MIIDPSGKTAIPRSLADAGATTGAALPQASHS